MKTIAALLVLVGVAAISRVATGADPVAATTADHQRRVLAATISRLFENAIPLEYEKKKDWDAKKTIPVLRWEGKGLHTHLVKRERDVNHGVWKHYKLKLIEPEKNLHIELVELRSIENGRTAFTLNCDAKIDAWARATVYEVGVHVVSLEMEGDMRVRLAIQGEIGLDVRGADANTSLALLPVVKQARLDLDEFHLRRVSDARGPIVHELGDGLSRLVEDEINGPRLVEKLNHAIEKKRERLAFRPAELFETNWWPLQNWLDEAAANAANATPATPNQNAGTSAEGATNSPPALLSP